MRILIHSIYYYPDLTGIGKYTGEMAEWLATCGHSVRVVTAPPYYPAWKISEGYKSCYYMREVVNGVDVWRCPLWVPSKPTGLKRIIHLASFAFSSLPVMLSQAFWRPDIVFVVEPPLFCAPQAWLTARLSGAKVWLHIQDFEIDAAFELGLLPKGWLRNVVSNVERWMMHRFDKISTISERMFDRLENKGVDSKRRVLFPNWVDAELIYPLDGLSSMRSELGIPEDTVVVLYSGNFGEKQGLEVVIEAAKLLAQEKDIVFLMCGDGAAKWRLRKLAEGVANVTFLPLQPINRLNDLLNLADIHLLPQRADAADLVMPSKLTGMLASGKPVIATANLGTQVAGIVDRCGLVTPPGDAKALAEAILQLASLPEKRKHLGCVARIMAVEQCDKEKILAQFEGGLRELVVEK